MSNQQSKRGQKRSASQAFGNVSIRRVPNPPKRRRLNGRRGNPANPGNWRQVGGARPMAGAAVAYASGQLGHAPVVNATRETCRVNHREFLGNVTGSVAFAIAQSISLNPGLAASFPWLSVIAQNWETYRFRKLRVCYYTRTGSNIPGSVLLAHDPDASDAAPLTELVMSTYQSLAEDAPWKDICLEVAKLGLNDLGPRKFVRTGALAANQDVKLYDAGVVHIGTVDGTAVAWGKLWLEYDIDFFTPQLPPAGVLTASTVRPPTVSGVVTAALLGTTQTILGPLVTGVAANVVSLDNLIVGNEYLFTYNITDSAGSAIMTWTPNAGLVNKTNPLGRGVATAATAASFAATFTAAAVTATMTLALVVSGTATNVMLTVSPIPVSTL